MVQRCSHKLPTMLADLVRTIPMTTRACRGPPSLPQSQTPMTITDRQRAAVFALGNTPVCHMGNAGAIVNHEVDGIMQRTALVGWGGRASQL